MNPDGPEIEFIPDIGFVVRISNIPGFGAWLYGQTMPYVSSLANPTDWAYYDDYLRFMRGLPVID